MILLNSTNFSRMSVGQSLPQHTYGVTPREARYCDQEGGKSKKSSTVILMEQQHSCSHGVGIGYRKAVGRGIVEAYQDGQGGSTEQ